MPSIVFFHGFLGRGDDWSEYVEAFSSLGFRAFSPDLPGHGFSSFQELEDLLPYLEPNAHWVGYSMGGRIALLLSKLLPAHFASLTLISTHPGLRTKEEKEERLKWENKWLQKLRHLPIDLFMKEWYAQPLFFSFSFPRKRLEQNKLDLEKAFQKFSVANQPPLWDHLLRIGQPVQMIFGEEDVKYVELKKDIEKIDTAQRIKLKIIPDCGHSVHLQNPSLLIGEILNLVLSLKRK